MESEKEREWFVFNEIEKLFLRFPILPVYVICARNKDRETERACPVQYS